MNSYRSPIVTIFVAGLITTGCQPAPIGGSSGQEGTTRVSVDTSAADPVSTDPAGAVAVTTPVDLSGSVAGVENELVSLNLSAEDIRIDEGSSDDEPSGGSSGTMTVAFYLSAGEPADACTDGALAGEFGVEVVDGIAVSIDSPSVSVGPDARDVLLGGQFDLCIQIEASFSADIVIDRIEVEFDGQTDQGSDEDNINNSEDSDADQMNDNDEEDDNVNDNDDQDDDQQNDNDDGMDDNENDNADDDNLNDNGADDAGNDQSDNTNDNTNDNSNDNSDNANDNDAADGNENDNATDEAVDTDNSNDNAE